MKGVGEWLEELGLGRYTELFAAHDIDFDKLPYLNPDLLRELGLPIGPRAKLLTAIESLRVSISPSGLTAAAKRAPDIAPRPEHLERRQITVLFCDLVDSTGLSRRLEPEDYRATIRQFQEVCSSAIAEQHGHVEQYLGDGIVAYFGWPAAEEVAAEQATFAGIAIASRVKNIEGPEPLAVRVGISTGLVVIGEPARGNPSVPSGAVGETPNLARRVQELASPDIVLVSSATQELIQSTFELEDLGVHELRGIPTNVRVYRVVGALTNASRFLAAKSRRLSPLVDRQAELALLEQRWRDAIDGEGQAVYVAGVPGIGKSRIVHELEQRIKSQARFTLRFQCSPHYVQSAFYPAISELQRLTGLTPNKPLGFTLARVKDLLSFEGAVAEHTLASIAKLLSADARLQAEEGLSTAGQVKEQIIEALLEVMVALARQGPTYCVVEDVQWIDASSQELLDRVVERISGMRFFLVITHRPEYKPNLAISGSATALTISRLARRDATELARLVLHEELALDSIVEKIVERSDAIPLYVEELARGAVESRGRNHSSQPGTSDASAAARAVPESLRDSLVSRLDRVPKGRQIAQVAAVIGREFTYALLKEVVALDANELEVGVDYLRMNDVIQPSGAQDRLAFKHALLRDAAYETLVRSARQEIHRRVAMALRAQSQDGQLTHPEVVAYHLSEAGHATEAASFWIAGARLARARSANIEAIAQLDSAIEQITLIDAGDERSSLELQIQLLLGLSCISALGYSSPRTKAAFQRAEVLSKELGDANSNFQATFGLWGHHWMVANHPRALELANLMVMRDLGAGPTESACVGHRSLGCTLFTQGEFRRARTELEEALRIGRELHQHAEGARYAVDPRIAAQLILGWNDWILGYPDRGLENVGEALRRAVASSDPYSIAFAHYVRSAVHFLRGEAPEALKSAETSYSISNE